MSSGCESFIIHAGRSVAVPCEIGRPIRWFPVAVSAAVFRTSLAAPKRTPARSSRFPIESHSDQEPLRSGSTPIRRRCTNGSTPQTKPARVYSRHVGNRLSILGCVNDELIGSVDFIFEDQRRVVRRGDTRIRPTHALAVLGNASRSSRRLHCGATVGGRLELVGEGDGWRMNVSHSCVSALLAQSWSHGQFRP